MLTWGLRGIGSLSLTMGKALAGRHVATVTCLLPGSGRVFARPDAPVPIHPGRDSSQGVADAPGFLAHSQAGPEARVPGLQNSEETCRAEPAHQPCPHSGIVTLTCALLAPTAWMAEQLGHLSAPPSGDPGLPGGSPCRLG